MVDRNGEKKRLICHPSPPTNKQLWCDVSIVQRLLVRMFLTKGTGFLVYIPKWQGDRTHIVGETSPQVWKSYDFWKGGGGGIFPFCFVFTEHTFFSLVSRSVYESIRVDSEYFFSSLSVVILLVN